MTIKTVLAPGAPWPKPEDWPVPFKHEQKPIRKVAPKKKPTPKPPKPPREKQKLSEAVVENGVFKHPKDDPVAKQRDAIKSLSLEPKQIFYFSKAKATK